MTDIEKLLASEEIKQLKARYFQSLDDKDWPGFLGVFTADVSMDFTRAFALIDPDSGEACPIFGKVELLQAFDTSSWRWTGHDEIMAAGPATLQGVVTTHYGFNPQITVHSANDASGIWAMQDMMRFPDGYSIREVHGYGRYHETYRRDNGRWLIRTCTLTRLRIDVS